MPIPETQAPIFSSSERLRGVPQLEVRARIDDIIPDIRPCTLRELQIFGRGFIPGTRSINLSAFNQGTMVYKDFLINNLSPDLLGAIFSPVSFNLWMFSG